MPLSGPQQPGFFLPGAEYFGLAPNTTIALQGRRRIQFASASVSVPANSFAEVTATATLETGFVAGSGIYIHDCWVQTFPQDGSGELSIASAFLVLSLSANNNGYPLGFPAATLVKLTGGIVSLRDQEKLIAWRDINPFSFPQGGTTLSIKFDDFISNADPSLAHPVQIVGGIVWTRLDGIQE